MKKKVFRTRFAPSPTGYLHIGTARTVLFTSLLAKKNHGEWFLRVEDTDQTRLDVDSFKKLLKSLDSLCLLPEEGITLHKTSEHVEQYDAYSNGAFGPYIQSKRLDLYHQNVDSLVEKNLAYWDYLNEDQKNELQEIKKASNFAIDYYEENLKHSHLDKLKLSFGEVEKLEKKPVLRFRLKRNDKVKCEDLLLGESVFDLNLLEDPVFLKSDGFPTYHFAHLIDDHLMQTTHVIRSQEWYPSIALHTQMFLDYYSKPLKYIHVPFILGETGNKKLSKRDSKVDFEEFIKDGYLPEAMINYLAFLGWNPGTEKELYLEKADF